MAVHLENELFVPREFPRSLHDEHIKKRIRNEDYLFDFIFDMKINYFIIVSYWFYFHTFVMSHGIIENRLIIVSKWITSRLQPNIKRLGIQI